VNGAPLPKNSALPRLILSGLIGLIFITSATPVALPAAFQRATALTAEQKYLEAAEVLNDAARRLPYESRALVLAGSADISAGRFESAVGRLRRAADLGGWTPSLHIAVGDALNGQGDTANAITEWELALAAWPDANVPDALLERLANAYEQVGRLAEASALLNRRLQSGTADPLVLYRQALLLAATSPAEATGSLAAVAQLSTDYAPNAQALLNAVQTGLNAGDEAYLFGVVGLQLVQMQEWALAEKALTQAVGLNNQFADAYAYLGLALDSQGKNGQPAYESALQLAPNSPLTQYLYGLHFRNLGQSGQALPYLLAAQQLDAQNPAIAAELGGAYAAQNDLPNAEIWFTQAVTLAPQNPQFWLLLARFHVDNEWKVADLGLPAARQAVGLNPSSALANDALGYALIITGDLVNGQKKLEEAMALDPSLSSIYYHLGQLYFIQGKTEEASAAFNRTLNLDPQGQYGKLAIQALAKIAPN
jgi:tetratricopeptide (TPR) repeat protein